MLTDMMEEQAEHIRAYTNRPVVTDPKNVSNTPCVLIEPPQFEPEGGTLCGGVVARWQVLVIGLPGTRASLGPLSNLLSEVFDAVGVWITAEPVAYVPLVESGQADPCQAYRVTYTTLEDI